MKIYIALISKSCSSLNRHVVQIANMVRFDVFSKETISFVFHSDHGRLCFSKAEHVTMATSHI